MAVGADGAPGKLSAQGQPSLVAWRGFPSSWGDRDALGTLSQAPHPTASVSLVGLMVSYGTYSA